MGEAKGIVEITIPMLQAGVEALRRWDRDAEPEALAVAGVFWAMLEADAKYHHSLLMASSKRATSGESTKC